MVVLEEMHTAVARIADRVGPSVVGLGRGWGLGSGVVIAPGEVLTSAHNLRRDEVTVTFADGRREIATVAGADADADIAVLAVDTGDAKPIAWEPDADPSRVSDDAGDAKPIAWEPDADPSRVSHDAGDAPADANRIPRQPDAAPVGSSDAHGRGTAAAARLGIGTPVIALANPGGRGLRATIGFVASERRSFRGPRGRRVRDAIEHTAPLPRGSSGGPLVDLDGRLLGLNSLRLEGGLILASPATAAVHELVRLLARGEAPASHRLGVAVAPPRVARKMRRAVGLPERDGLLVRAVEDGGPAARAGVERGDLLVRAGDRDLTSVDALYAALDALPAAGGSVALAVVRGTDERSMDVTFDGGAGRCPASAEAES